MHSTRILRRTELTSVERVVLGEISDRIRVEPENNRSGKALLRVHSGRSGLTVVTVLPVAAASRPPSGLRKRF